MTNEDHHTVKEFSKLFEVSTSTVYSWIRKGKLTAIRVNGNVIIERDGLFSTFVSDFIKKKYETEL